MNLGPRTAIVLSLIVALSMFAPPVIATSPDDIPDDETFTTNNVEVWEESIFTLRHDLEDAPTAVETGDFRAGLGTGGDSSLNREFLGVRTAGDEVILGYDPSRAQLSEEDITDSEVQLVAARVTGSGEPVTTFSEAIDLISQENANTNATFEMVDSSRSLSDGETTFTHEGDAGHYVYFVVDRGNGQFSVTDGEIEIATGTPTIIGVEQITFQRGSPESVSAPAIAEPGDDLSFDIDTTNQFATDDVTHTVLVYDQSKFSDINDGQFTVQVSDRSEIDTDFNLSEDAELFHEIDEVNGVADVEDGIEVNGIDISDGRVSRAVSLGAVVDFVAEDLDGNPPDTTATGDVQLDASVTADAQENRDHTVTVETANNWTPGSYRYVIVSSLESNASAVTTSTGTVSIQEDVGDVTAGSSIVSSTGETSISVNGDNIRSADFSGLRAGTTASVNEISNSYVSETPSTDNVRGYFEINADTATRGGTATVNATFEKSRFDDVSNAQVFRYDTTAGNFAELSTTKVSETGSTVTLQFTTGFSLFAIGESSGGGGGGGGGGPPSSGGGGGGGGGGSSSAAFTVSNLTPQDVEVTQGDEITVSATVTTDSYLEDTQDVEFRVSGQTVANQSVSLENQESTTVEFTGIDTSNLEEGSYEHGIFTNDDNQTATLVVTLPADEETTEQDQQEEDQQEEDQQEEDQQEDEQQDEDTTQQEEQEPAEETDDGIPGFGAIVALIAVIAAALLATRRED